MTILVVDHELYDRKLLARQLQRFDLDEVILCESGAHALSVLDRNPEDVHLIFCDLQMPGMDGVEFVRHLAEYGYAKGVVLVSGEASRTLHAAEKLAKAYALRVHGVLQKPVQPEQLGAILGHVETFRSSTRKNVRKQYAAEELQLAIDNDELINVYQPKIAANTGKLIGVESLVRWQHSTDGLIYPDQFIPVAEEAGLIQQLTVKALNQAAHATRSWLNAGVQLHIAVNISMDSLTALDFPDQVMHAIADAQLPPAALCLELTESKLMQDTKVPLDILTRLRLKGVSLSLDDFGTGHSSLVQLRNLPFDELKLDRSFVHGAVHDRALEIILKSNVEMARQLGLRTVAEGIEDIDDWNFLRKIQIDLIQGYFVAKPMPAAELLTWLPQWEQRIAKLIIPIE